MKLPLIAICLALGVLFELVKTTTLEPIPVTGSN